MSVLLPLQDGRDAGVECVRAWLSQDADPSEFELLALAPGEDPDLELAVRPLLRQRDRWLVKEGADEYELFDFGAERARGEFVFVTEAHCVPDPDCLSKMLAELERSGAPGVRGASIPEAVGPLGELERAAFIDYLTAEEEPEHWRKVLIHSLALRRETYLRAGGLPTRYGDFAPWVLSVALHEGGERLVHSRAPRVRHVYDGDLRDLARYVQSFGHGELLFRGELSEEAADRYLDPAAEWEQGLELRRAGALHSLRAIRALGLHGLTEQAGRAVAVAVLGWRAEVALARAGARLAAIRAARASEDRARRAAFKDFWRLNRRIGRLQSLVASGPAAPEALPEDSRIGPFDSLAGRAVGFHVAERLEDGSPIRWTAPLAVLRVQVPAAGATSAGGKLTARIALHPARPADSPAGTRVAVDGRAVPALVSDTSIEFEVGPGERWVALASSPLRPRLYGVEDERTLGVCVRSISFEPFSAPASPFAASDPAEAPLDASAPSALR
jgi:hypothetical protein